MPHKTNLQRFAAGGENVDDAEDVVVCHVADLAVWKFLHTVSIIKKWTVCRPQCQWGCSRHSSKGKGWKRAKQFVQLTC